MLAGILSSPGYLRSLWAARSAAPSAISSPTAGPTSRRRERGCRLLCAARWVAPSPGMTSRVIANAGKGPLVVKGILHPGRCRRPVSRLALTASSSPTTAGGKSRALPAAIDVLPAHLPRAVDGRATVMLDSGVRFGARLWCAAPGAWRRSRILPAKAFLWGLGALGAEGPLHVIDLMIEEMKSALGQIGAFAGRRQGACGDGRGHPGGVAFLSCMSFAAIIPELATRAGGASPR